MDKPIKNLGLHPISVQLHPEVLVKVSLNVARSTDEAERQSRGENVAHIKDEKVEIETFNPDEAFEGGSAPSADSDEA
jgi:large subunit ribosomal protein L9